MPTESGERPELRCGRALASCSAPARSTTRCAATRKGTTCVVSTGHRWPAPAQLMIRQDESVQARERTGVHRHPRAGARPEPRARRSSAPSRSARRSGVTLARRGFSLRLGDRRDSRRPNVTEELFLDALAGITHVESRSIGRALTHLRAGASARHVARVRLRPAGARRAHVADPQRRRVRSQARDPDLPRRPRRRLRTTGASNGRAGPPRPSSRSPEPAGTRSSCPRR